MKQKIIILHHHLKPGGVTRIISSQIKALQKSGFKDITILTGSKPAYPDDFPADIKINKELDYLDKVKSATTLKKKYQKILQYLEKNISTDSVLHVHNLNLGKNPLLTLSVAKLAKNGIKIFNHAHDFSEDREENQKFLKKIIKGVFKKKLKKTLYPEFSNYRYGVLNRFDYDRLVNKGIKESKIEFLPNPVSAPPKTDKKNSRKKICKKLNIDYSKQIMVYPVRVIRRKNIGELILLAYLFRDSAEFLITLPPQNPVEIKDYEDWLEFCDEKHFENLHFEVGTKFEFEEVMYAADKIITTSIKEGFGMMYLEPWLFGKAVAGRNIDYVTEDFIESGIDYPLLYNSIDIAFIDHYRWLDSHDFGFLPKKEQMEIITLIMNNKNLQSGIFKLNPNLKKIIESVPENIIKKNKKLIQSDYSLKKYGERLNEIYSKFY